MCYYLMKISQNIKILTNLTKWLMWNKIEHFPRCRSSFLVKILHFSAKISQNAKDADVSVFFNFLETLVNYLYIYPTNAQSFKAISRSNRQKSHGKFQVKIFLRILGHPGCNPILSHTTSSDNPASFF